MPFTVTTLGEPVRGTTILVDSGLSSGNAITGSNVGTGSGVFKNTIAGTLNFKSLIGNNGVIVTSNTNDLTFTVDSSYINALISALPGVTLTANKAVITNASGNLTTSATSDVQIGYLSNVTSDIQAQIGGKQTTITGAATTVTSLNLSPNTVVISNGSGKLANSTVTSTELSYLTGVTSNIQNQIDDIVIPAAITGLTTGYIPKALSSTTIGNSLISESGGIINIGGNLSILNGFRTQNSGIYYNKKTIAFYWDMNTVPRLAINHGVYLGANFHKIKSIDCMVYTNAGTTIVNGGIAMSEFKLNSTNSVTKAIVGDIIGYNNTQIELWANPTEFFGTNALFGGTTYQRGELTITYEI